MSLKSAMFQTGDRVQFTKEGHRNIEAGRQGIVKSLNNLWLQVLYDGDSKTKGTRRAHAKLIASHSTSDLASNSAELGDREKAVKKAKRKAKEAAEDAKNEKENQAKLAAATKERLQGQDWRHSSAPLTTPPKRKWSVNLENMKPFCGTGELVRVCSRTDAGHNRPAGVGYVMKTSGVGAATIFDVRYNSAYDNGRLHRNICIGEITVVSLGSVLQTNKRTRECAKHFSPPTPAKKAKTFATTPEQRLVDDLKASARQKRGWRRAAMRMVLGLPPLSGKKLLTARMEHAEKQQILGEARLLESHFHASGGAKSYGASAKRTRNGTFKPRGKKELVSIRRLVQHGWGKSNSYLCTLRKGMLIRNVADVLPSVREFCNELLAPPAKDKEKDRKSVITSLKEASKRFTAKNLFVLNKCRVAAESDLSAVSREEADRRKKDALNEWDDLDEGSKEMWEAKRRQHLTKQSQIKGIIVEALQTDPTMSWEKIAGETGDWCSADTIRRFVTSHGSYTTYAERILPLLNCRQKLKHCHFARRLLNNHYLGNGKYLLVHYDEKWFWALVLRANAKACTELGIEKKTFNVFHKNHIDKVMCLAITGYAYENSIENGGVGLKLGFYRCGAAKIAKKRQRQATKDANGNTRYQGPVLREAGDVYWVDTTVTGSALGTSKDPKFPLKPVFEHSVFPNLDDLVKPGGKFEGYTVIIQGDQAGPHEEDDFVRYMRLECSNRGWCFEPQSPQSPHLNNLDLAVFPAMSRRHSTESRKRNQRVLKKEEIWDCAFQVWKELPSCKIARGFLQVRRLAEKVLASKGENRFLLEKGKKGLHCGGSADFHDTADGIRRNDSKTFTAVQADPSKHAERLHVHTEKACWQTQYPFPKKV